MLAREKMKNVKLRQKPMPVIASILYNSTDSKGEEKKRNPVVLYKDFLNLYTQCSFYLCLAELLLERCNPFILNLLLFLLLARILDRKLIGTSDGNVLGAEVTEHVLQHLFNYPTATVIKDHDAGHGNLELGCERDQLELLVDFRNKFGSAREGDAGNHDDSVVHALVLLDRLAERTALVVDGKGGDLLNQLQEVDGRVEK
jgi:hypothetical protein